MTGVLLEYLPVRPHLWSTGKVKYSRSENILYFSFSVSNFRYKFEPCLLTTSKQFFFIDIFKACFPLWMSNVVQCLSGESWDGLVQGYTYAGIHFTFLPPFEEKILVQHKLDFIFTSSQVKGIVNQSVNKKKTSKEKWAFYPGCK